MQSNGVIVLLILTMVFMFASAAVNSVITQAIELIFRAPVSI